MTGKSRKGLSKFNSRDAAADIRNKLQTSEALADMCLAGSPLSRDFIIRTKKDLAEVTKLLNRLERMLPDMSRQTKPNLDKAFKHVERACKKKFKK